MWHIAQGIFMDYGMFLQQNKIIKETESLNSMCSISDAYY